MGILDSIIGSVKNDLEHKASRGITDTISKGVDGTIKKGPASNACPKCRKAIPEPRPKFCQECGAALMVSCKKCKAEYPVGTKFCTECGNKLG
ncbi:MAG: zinc ribbon domain-containing protein [Candidatus Micrarchaeota archaeon]|nr:zinc ribbon domain-containing protein [Candidatus Micrarchaeota archaeon]